MIQNRGYLVELKYSPTRKGKSAILCPNANETDWQTILKLIDDADTLLSIDCIRLDQESQNSVLRLQIEQDKKLIYERRT